MTEKYGPYENALAGKGQRILKQEFEWQKLLKETLNWKKHWLKNAI